MKELDTKGLYWNDSLSLGVESIDADHKQLFAILHHVLRLLSFEEKEKNEFACREALDFLAKYTVRHFAREEAFQREIGYAGYAMHKELHDNLRQVTLPDMAQELERQKFSREAVEQFIGLFTGWLMWHVMIEDQAITGKRSSLWESSGSGDAIEAADAELRVIMQSLLREEARLINRHYNGEQLRSPVSYIMNYETEQGKYELVFIADKPALELFARRVLGQSAEVTGTTIFMTFVELSRMMADRLLRHLYAVKQPQLKAHRGMAAPDLAKRFKDGFPELSLLWRLKDGVFGLCLTQTD